MATATQPIVVLTREQRDALCEHAWSYLFEGAKPNDPAFEVRVTIASGQLFDALQYAEDTAADTFELAITPEIAWLTREPLNAFAETERELIEQARSGAARYPAEHLDVYLATVAALDAILEVA